MANAYTNTNTNMTTSTGLTPGMQTYYNRELLRTFEPNLVHLQFGENYRMPMNSGITMNMRKMIPVAAKTTALEEGNPGDGKMLAEVAVTTPFSSSATMRGAAIGWTWCILTRTSLAAFSASATRARAVWTRSFATSWRPAPTSSTRAARRRALN